MKYNLEPPGNHRRLLEFILPQNESWLEFLEFSNLLFSTGSTITASVSVPSRLVALFEAGREGLQLIVWPFADARMDYAWGCENLADCVVLLSYNLEFKNSNGTVRIYRLVNDEGVFYSRDCFNTRIGRLTLTRGEE